MRQIKGNVMSRRIVYAFAIAGCAAFVAPASADRECFESSCRMPEVMEAPEAAPEAIVEPVTAQPQATAAQPSDPQSQAAASNAGPKPESLSPGTRPAAASAKPAPGPIRPQMVVDRSPPALKPLPFAPHEPIRPPSRSRTADVQEPVEAASRGEDAAYTAPGYGAPYPVQPDARVIVVTPGYSYGDDGVVLAHKRHDPSWTLCQTGHGRGDSTCSPYQYHAFGEHGYRPLGSYRTQRAVPVRVHVPDAKIIAVLD
jgi:hypothetical protein